MPPQDKQADPAPPIPAADDATREQLAKLVEEKVTEQVAKLADDIKADLKTLAADTFGEIEKAINEKVDDLLSAAEPLPPQAAAPVEAAPVPAGEPDADGLIRTPPQ